MLQLGAWLVSARATDAGVQERLAAALAPWLAADDVAERPHRDTYSAKLAAEESGRGVRDLGILYFGTTPVVRSPDPARIVRGLLRHLSAFAAEAGEGVVRVDAMGWIVDGEAVITPRAGCDAALVSDRRLTVDGVRLVDAPFLHLDLSTGEVVVPEPVLASDAAGAVPDGGESPGPAEAAPGRYPIRSWQVVGSSSAGDTVMSALAAVFEPDRRSETMDGLMALGPCLGDHPPW